ncbi:EamA family transporter RarD [soil metagenome]
MLAVSAYLCWGFAPLYWPLVDESGSVEILAHRFVWSLVFVGILLLMFGGFGRLGVLLGDRLLMVRLFLASTAIAINWGLFIYAVTHDHVIEASLGYFINPLVSVLLGVVVLGERLRPVQWCAVALGAMAVIVLSVGYGRLPYLALAIAFSFGIYGLLKKQANLGAREGLFVETLCLAPVALAFLIVIEFTGDATFGHAGVSNALLLAGTGVITAVPLLLFGGAATRLSLSTIGILQYLGPVIQFILGLVVFHEAMTGARWIGFLLVWSALAVFTLDALTNHRRIVRRTAEASAI